VVAAAATLHGLPLRGRPLLAALVFVLLVLAVSAVWGVRYALFTSMTTAIAFVWLAPRGGGSVRDLRELFVLFALLVVGITGSYLSDRARKEAVAADQRRAEAVAAQKRFADLVDSVEGVVWEADAATLAFSFVSRQAERVLGCPAERWLREPAFWKDHVHADDRERAVECYLEVAAAHRSRDLEYRMIAADGAVVWVRDLVSPVIEQGRASRLRGVMVDITCRRRAEQERERLHQLEADLARINRVTTLGELTASLAHEINQPIAAAAANAGACVRWLAGSEPDLEEARKAARRIVDDANRAAQIVQRIRLLFKKGVSQQGPVDVNEIVTEIVALARVEASRCGVSIRRELAPGLPRVQGDRVQLQQVVMNLVMNGIDAMKEVDGSRELMLASRLDGDGRVTVSVGDTGIGLPPEATRIFDAFFTTKPHGTGMGLAISRTIVESHGGRLWASSNSGRGAVFRFALPKIETTHT
jgi:PAS domain S-box-containing protein